MGVFRRPSTVFELCPAYCRSSWLWRSRMPTNFTNIVDTRNDCDQMPGIETEVRWCYSNMADNLLSYSTTALVVYGVSCCFFFLTVVFLYVVGFAPVRPCFNCSKWGGSSSLDDLEYWRDLEQQQQKRKSHSRKFLFSPQRKIKWKTNRIWKI